MTIPWFKVDDAFHSHPKVIEASNSAIGLWTLAGTWCAQYLTDGELKHSHVARFGGTQEEALELVEAGLWEATDQGFRFIDWHDYQPTKESIKETRRRDLERKKKGREAQSGKRDPKGNVSARNPDGIQTESSRPDPTRPYIKSSRAKPKTPFPAEWTPTESHAAKAAQLSLNLQWEAEKFEEHHRSKDNRYADWGLAFHTWLKHAAEYQQRNGSAPRPQSTFDPWASDWSEDDIRRRKNQ